MQQIVGLYILLFFLFSSCAGEKQLANPTGTLTDERDGRVYKTVKIGNQWWMAENLNFGIQILSFSGGTNQDGEMTDNRISEKYCYENNDVYCGTYGGLYQWAEAVNYVNAASPQGLCPDGWHVPSEDEFLELLEYYPSCLDLRFDGTSGFNAYLAGNKFHLYFDNLNVLGLFWSSSASQLSGRYLLINRSDSPARINSDEKKYGLSIRCVADPVSPR